MRTFFINPNAILSNKSEWRIWSNHECRCGAVWSKRETTSTSDRAILQKAATYFIFVAAVRRIDWYVVGKQTFIRSSKHGQRECCQRQRRCVGVGERRRWCCRRQWQRRQAWILRAPLRRARLEGCFKLRVDGGQSPREGVCNVRRSLVQVEPLRGHNFVRWDEGKGDSHRCLGGHARCVWTCPKIPRGFLGHSFHDCSRCYACGGILQQIWLCARCGAVWRYPIGLRQFKQSLGTGRPWFFGEHYRMGKILTATQNISRGSLVS